MKLDPTRVKKMIGDTVYVKKINNLKSDKIVIINYNNQPRAQEAWEAQVILFNDNDDYFKKNDNVLIEPQALDCPEFEWGDELFYMVKKDDIICAINGNKYIVDPIRTFIDRNVKEKIGSIYIPNAENKLSLYGEVIYSNKFKKGTKVFYKKSSAIKIKNNLICVDNHNIIAKESN